MYVNLSKVTKNLIVAFSLLTLATCKKDVYQTIPYTEVNVELNIPTDLSSLGIGSAMVCPTREYDGVKGIIIYKGFDSDGNTQYMAYERLCTNYPNDTCAIVLDKSTITATCPSCKSQFEMTMGSVTNGPARLSLKQYRTTISGSKLYITN
jgi:Rieske Fe-S protein